MTIATMGTRTSIAQDIVDKEADGVLALKDKQPRLFSEAHALFVDAMAVGFRGVEHRMMRQVAGGHGRVEVGQAWVITDPAHVHDLDPEGTWPNLRSIVLVRAERRCGDRVSHEGRYDRSSRAGPCLAPILNQAMRAQWASENSRHWMLDVAFREDASRVRTGHVVHTLALPRRLAPPLLQRASTARCGTNANRLTAGREHGYSLQALAR